MLILHLEASPDWSAAEPELYDEKNAGANKKHVYADRAALTVLRESYHKTKSHTMIKLGNIISFTKKI